MKCTKTFDDIVLNNKKNGNYSQYILFAENGTGNFLAFKNGESHIYFLHHEANKFVEIFDNLIACITYIVDNDIDEQYVLRLVGEI